jgi:hypothetical protein
MNNINQTNQSSDKGLAEQKPLKKAGGLFSVKSHTEQ